MIETFRQNKLAWLAFVALVVSVVAMNQASETSIRAKLKVTPSQVKETVESGNAAILKRLDELEERLARD